MHAHESSTWGLSFPTTLLVLLGTLLAVPFPHLPVPGTLTGCHILGVRTAHLEEKSTLIAPHSFQGQAKSIEI